MKIKNPRWYSIDPEKAEKYFEGDLTYIGEFSVSLNVLGYYPCMVFKDAKPNRKKNHKDYLILYKITSPLDAAPRYMISGKSINEIEKCRYQAGVHCLECDTVVYSVSRHDLHYCGCPNEAMVDGGKYYLRCGAKDINKIKLVKIDLLEQKVTGNSENE